MKREQVAIHTPYIKLDSMLKFQGIAETGGHAKEMIQSGEVFVDGLPCLQRGKKVIPGMVVSVPRMDMEFEVTVVGNHEA